MFYFLFRITIFGCSARYLQSLEEHHITPRTHNKLETVHTILSTGSPLHSRIFDYVYTDIKTNVLLGSITGGTDIVYRRIFVFI
jgi:acetoacetyl-CoA synthetase